MVLNFQVLKTNTSDESIELRYRETFNAAFLERGDEWEVCVTKLAVPSSLFETFYMTDNNDYSLSIVASNITTKSQIEYSNYMPDDRDIKSSSISYGPVKYYNNNQVLEMMSRTLYHSFADYVKSFDPSYHEVIDLNFLFDSSVMNAPFTTRNEDFTVSLNQGKIAHIEFLLSSFNNSTNAWEYANPTALMKSGGNITVTLTSPNGTSVVLFSTAGTDIELTDNNRYLVFTEAAYNVTNTLSITNTNKTFYYYRPNRESLLKLTNESPNGTWNIKIDSEEAIYGNMNFSLLIFTVPDDYPTFAPTLNLNSNNSITLNYEEKYVKKDIKILFSPKIKSMADFSIQHRYNSKYDKYEFIYPSYIFNNSNGIVSYEQINSTRFMLSNLSRILISSNLGTDNDYTSGLSMKNALTDFSIDTDTNDFGIFIHSDSAIPWRRYRLNDQQIRSLELEVYLEYTNGTTKIAMIPAGSQAVIRLSFFSQSL